MKQMEHEMSWKEFFVLIKSIIPSKSLMLLAIAFSAISSGASLLIPATTQNIVDGVADNYLNEKVIVIMVALFLLNAIFSGVSIYLLTFLGQRTTENLRLKLWKKMIFLPVSFFNEKPSGKLVSQMTNDTTQVKNVVTTHIITIISGGFSIIGSIISFRLETHITYYNLWCDYGNNDPSVWKQNV